MIRFIGFYGVLGIIEDMLDAEIVRFIQGIFLSSDILQGIAWVFARVFIFLFLPLFAWIWFRKHRGDRKKIYFAVWTAGIALLLSESVSLLVMRTRPYLMWSDIIATIPPPLTFSFPSSHVTLAVALTAMLFFMDRYAGWIGVFLCLGIACGRLATGVHYPSDLIGGIFFGLLAFFIVFYLHQLAHRRKKRVP